VEEEASTPKEQTLSLFSKYDFVAGDKVVFFEDFSQDAVAIFRHFGTQMLRAKFVQQAKYQANGLS
jgi:hypothetical protein